MAELWMAVLTGIVGLRLSIIDFEEHRLPDRFTLPLAGALPLCVWAWGESSQWWWGLCGAVLTTLLFLLFALLPRRSLGWGDVKFQWSLGFFLGAHSWWAPFVGVLLTFLLSGCAAIVGLLRRRMSLESALPLGPYMTSATFLVVAFAL